MDIVARVAARFRLSYLEEGRSVFTEENLKIHRYRDHLRITDMTFAGKRGKTVKTLVVEPEYSVKPDLADRVLKQAVTSIVGKNYAQAKAKLDELLDKYPQLLKLSESTARGVDVEPMGTPIELERKFDDGSSLEIKATPHSFLVNHSAMMRNLHADKPGFKQDTLYSERSKKDGIVFYAWAKDNISKLAKMTIMELRETWDKLGVGYDYH